MVCDGKWICDRLGEDWLQFGGCTHKTSPETTSGTIVLQLDVLMVKMIMTMIISRGPNKPSKDSRIRIPVYYSRIKIDVTTFSFGFSVVFLTLFWLICKCLDWYYLVYQTQLPWTIGKLVGKVFEMSPRWYVCSRLFLWLVMTSTHLAHTSPSLEDTMCT